MDVVRGIPEGFSVEAAEGVQLDLIGEAMGVRREDARMDRMRRIGGICGRSWRYGDGTGVMKAWKMCWKKGCRGWRLGSGIWGI